MAKIEVNQKAIERTKEKIKQNFYLLNNSEAEMLVRELVEDVPMVVGIYLKCCAEIEAEEEKKCKKEQTEKMMADVGYFPGDCCD